MIVLDKSNKILSETQEDYLKQIYLLTEEASAAGTQALADRLGVAPASVTVMLQKLSHRELVTYEQYKGVSLTPSGKAVALEILRHHRLLETFLQKALDYSWEEVHDEAERLEHYISETFESRIAAFLGHPSHDPHGDPIPDALLNLPEDGDLSRLTDQGANFSGIITRVSTQDKDELNLFWQLGLVPGASLTLQEVRSDALRVLSGPEPYLLPRSLAQKLWVKKVIV